MASRFTKSIDKGHLPALGKPEKGEYEQQKENIHKLERKSTLLFKDSKKYLDAQASVYKTEVKLVSDLARDFSGTTDNSKLQSLGSDWFNKTVSAERTVVSQRIAYLRESLKVKSKQYHGQFPPVYAEIKKLEQISSEYLKLKAKVAKYQGSPRSGNNLVKLHVYQNLLEEVTAKMNDTEQELHVKMGEFYDSRLTYFQPILDSLTNSNIQEAAEFNKMYNELAVVGPMTDEEFAKNFKKKLSEVSKLTIVADQSV